MSSSVLTLLAFTAIASFPLTSSASISAESRAKRSAAEASNEYAWVCPTATCAPISEQCSEVEIMVFEYDVLLGNRVVSVRCQSCEYCLDMPSMRSRRSARSRRHSRPCQRAECPSVSAECTDVRLTDVFVDGQLCKQCPGCYDNIIISSP